MSNDPVEEGLEIPKYEKLETTRQGRGLGALMRVTAFFFFFFQDLLPLLILSNYVALDWIWEEFVISAIPTYSTLKPLFLSSFWFAFT